MQHKHKGYLGKKSLFFLRMVDNAQLKSKLLMHIQLLVLRGSNSNSPSSLYTFWHKKTFSHFL